MQYLAMIRCNCDDISIGLYPTKAKARGALRRCTREEVKRVEDIFGLDITTFIGGTVVTFGDDTRVVEAETGVPVSKDVQAYLTRDSAH